MRFLTAYFAVNDGREVLTGSQRMTERPIKVLVEALEQLGAKYPMKRSGLSAYSDQRSKLQLPKLIPANVSSQYISALISGGKIRKQN
jgi:3-phosphoshikimate 1-carboxyvinyltransferase